MTSVLDRRFGSCVGIERAGARSAQATMDFVMPPSVDEKAEERATRLEREAEDAIAGRFCPEEGIRPASEALAIRQAFQGEEHRDLIWPLSLWIEALRCLPDAR
ncbi:MAG TPA: hypothetical protein VKP67_20960, partial [Xanthobacteraceae bacterium]|nr:hypothetical protein [Xanthobacteraceae bacterium]